MSLALDLRKALTVSFICVLVFYLPLIDVRYYFLDDIGRALEGYGKYTAAGRPLVDILLGLLSLGLPLTDIAPASQLLGVLSLALAAVLLAARFGITSPVSVGVFALAVGGSPYFLENMSFRFDAGFMALGVLCAIAPFWFAGSSNTMPILSTSALLFASLCLYQPTVNCYGVIALYLTARSLPCKPVAVALGFGLRCAVPLGVAVFAYWSLWKILPVDLGTPLATHGRFAPLGSALSTAASNFSVFARTAIRDWGTTWLGLIWCLMVGGTAVILGWRIARSPERSWGARVGVTGLATALLMLIFPAAFLSQIFLAQPAVVSRAFTGSVAVIAVFSSALLTAGSRTAGRLAKALVAFQAVALVSVAYTYANALRAQERWDDQITSAIVNDILEMEPTGKVWTFGISGWTGRSPLAAHALAKYPALERSVFSVIYQDSYWAAARFKTLGLWVKPAPGSQIERMDLICRGVPRKSNARYDLYLVDNMAFIRFKNDGVRCS